MMMRVTNLSLRDLSRWASFLWRRLRPRSQSTDRSPGTVARTAQHRAGSRSAVFLDRDGTLIEDTHYLVDPRSVRLLPGVTEALRQLRAAGFACVVVTNQSAIGRGMLTEKGLRLIHEELTRQLGAQGAILDAIYHCPAAPGGGGRTVIEHPDRKPGPGMLLRAATELGLNLGASWMVGDTLSDALAGRNAGCRGSILVETGREPCAAWNDGTGRTFPICRDLLEAVHLILDPAVRAATGSETLHAGTQFLLGSPHRTPCPPGLSSRGIPS